MALCPSCGSDVSLSGSLEISEIITCKDCGSDLEFGGENTLSIASQ